MIVAVAGLAGVARAQPKPSPAVPPPESAITSVTSTLARALPDVPGPVLVVGGKLTSDIGAPRADALSVTIARVFAGARSWAVASEVMSLGDARIAARRYKHLAHVLPVIQKGRLLLTVDVYPIPSTVWARARNPSPGSRAHAFAEAPIDAEVRSYLDALPLEDKPAGARAKSFERDVLALACADLDRDGAPEILMSSRGRISLARIRGGAVVPVLTRSWADLSPLDPTPMREPVALLAPQPIASVLAPDRRLVASITDRARAVVLDARLEPVAAFAGMAIPDGERFACARMQDLVVTGPLDRCDDGAPTPTRASVGGRYDALASGAFVEPSGKTFRVTAGREDRILEVFDDAGHKTRGPRIGAQLALGDRNQDGAIEVFTSLDVEPGGADAVVELTWDRVKSKLTERTRFPVAAGVRALAVCPPDTTKRAALVVATSDELWVMR